MLRGIAFVARRELTLIARHPALALLTTILPLVLLALLAAVFLQGTPTGLPVAVVDLDRTPTASAAGATPTDGVSGTGPSGTVVPSSDSVRRTASSCRNVTTGLPSAMHSIAKRPYQPIQISQYCSGRNT